MNKVLAGGLVLFLMTAAVAQETYFQQKIEYNIVVDLDPESARLAGSELVAYHNNSPDTLKEIYFHLYYNAFQPGSYLDRLLQDNNDYWISSLNPPDMGFAEVELLRIGGQDIHDYQVNNTIMKVSLPSPLLPKSSVSFYLEFKCQVPVDGYRTGHREKHFDIGQWYPKPALYDRRGWHINQYLPNSEFFADFADYDVEITLPSKFIIAHSGELLNEAEIFSGKLPAPSGDSIIIDALKYIVKDTAGGRPSTIPGVDYSEGNTVELQQDRVRSGFAKPFRSAIASDTVIQAQDVKTWKIRAENIHDFAFCADPDFTIDICRYKDTIIKSYYTEEIQDRWKRKAAEYTKKAIELYSMIYFPYPYKQFSAVAAIVSAGGMEYPQLVMIGEDYSRGNVYSNKLESVIAHEVGHNWYQGIMAFNESEQAFLDEGLTSFATIEYMEHYYGRQANDFSFSKAWQKKLLPNGNERNDAQRLYIQRALMENEDPMNTPANLFKDGWGYYYNASYHKAASVYFMLQYTLGEDGFRRFLRILFERWAYRHPYLSDLQDIAEEVYHGDLGWFFRQWFTTTWTLNYTLNDLSSKKAVVDGRSGYLANVSVENRGRCISPLDLAFYLEDGTIDTAWVPVSEWSDGEHAYDTTVFLGAKPLKAVLNPDLRLADIDRLNNCTGMFPIHWQFMVPRLIYPENHVEHYVESYTIAHNPTLWYNSVDGAGIGYRFEGSYLGIARNLKLKATIGLEDRRVSYDLSYNNKWFSFDPDVYYHFSSKEWEGRGRQQIGLRFESESEENAGNTQADLSLYRNYPYSSSYLFADGWSRGNVNTVDLSFGHKSSSHFYELYLQGSLTSSIPWSDYQFSRVALGLGIFMSAIGVGETRFTLKAGKADGHVPLQRRFYLSSADPYDIWESPLYRSKGTLPDRWKKEGHLFKPGGAGLTGYLNYGLTGTRMLSITVANDLPQFRLPVNVPLLSAAVKRISSEAYFAGGYVWDKGSSFSIDSLVWEAGFVLRYQIPYLDRVLDECRLSLYLPLWLSRPGKGATNFEWRWLVSLTP